MSDIEQSEDEWFQDLPIAHPDHRTIRGESSYQIDEEKCVSGMYDLSKNLIQHHCQLVRIHGKLIIAKKKEMGVDRRLSWRDFKFTSLSWKIYFNI